MKSISTFAIALLAIASSGCMNDQTKAMTLACQGLLQQSEQTDLGTFIGKAEERVASLKKPRNKVVSYLRDLQDPEALAYRNELEQCIWQLKVRRQ